MLNNPIPADYPCPECGRSSLCLGWQSCQIKVAEGLTKEEFVLEWRCPRHGRFNRPNVEAVKAPATATFSPVVLELELYADAADVREPDMVLTQARTSREEEPDD